MIFVWIHFTGIKGCLLTFERMGGRGTLVPLSPSFSLNREKGLKMEG